MNHIVRKQTFSGLYAHVTSFTKIQRKSLLILSIRVKCYSINLLYENNNYNYLPVSGFNIF